VPDGRGGQPEFQNIRLTAWVHGHVQGVGFRWWTRRQAIRLGLTGYASNLADGRVEIVAEGSRAGCVRLLEELRSGRTPGWVETVVERWSPARGDLTGFVER
jgi:acylphosphatase